MSVAPDEINISGFVNLQKASPMMTAIEVKEVVKIRNKIYPKNPIFIFDENIINKVKVNAIKKQITESFIALSLSSI